MKKIFLIIMLVSLGSVSAQEMSQREPGQNNERGMRKEHRQRLKDLSPQQRAQLEAKQMTLRLNLTDKQQKEVEALLATKFENQKERPPREERKQLTKEERLQRKNEFLDKQIAFKRSMQKILNEEQMAQWEEAIKKRNKKTRNKGKRGRKGNN